MSGLEQHALPLVSIVTPCFNMARFVEETVESVLAQDYPNIEYLVMDGGSSDGTLELLRRYEDRVRIHSGPDRGPADAINRGFERTSGEIVTFLAADDYYFPGAVSAAVRELIADPGTAVVYGLGTWVDENGETIGEYPVKPYSPERLIEECYICQPASFLRRDAVEAAGMLAAELRYTFDYDLWIRLSRGCSMRMIDYRLAAARMHATNISLGSRRKVFRETITLLRRHYGYVPFRQIHSYCSFLMDSRDQFFEPLNPSFSKYAASLPVGLYYNWRRPVRYLRDWGRVMTKEGLQRRLSATWTGKSS